MAPSSDLAPPSAYLLADHLDCVLSAGEDMVEAGRGWMLSGIETSADALLRVRDAQRAAVEQLRALEFSIIARVQGARRGAEALAAEDPRFRLIAQLFVSGTAPFVDAVAECYDSTDQDFETGDSLLAYLLSRGLVPPDTGSTDGVLALNVNDDFLVAERIRLGVLLELVAQFLDMLELHYELYGEEKEEAAEPPAEAAPERDRDSLTERLRALQATSSAA
jgi:hypothetical protein